MKGKPSAWSEPQELRVVYSSSDLSGNGISPKWIGAITKKDARLPEGRFSNAEFKKDYFKEKWNPVDTLSSKSILLRKSLLPALKPLPMPLYT